MVGLASAPPPPLWCKFGRRSKIGGLQPNTAVWRFTDNALSNDDDRSIRGNNRLCVVMSVVHGAKAVSGCP